MEENKKQIIIIAPRFPINGHAVYTSNGQLAYESNYTDGYLEGEEIAYPTY
jgi:antitoxin component YwqK of YwqJK toxin-antitoxin module